MSKDFYADEISELHEQIRKLKAENEQLRARLDLDKVKDEMFGDELEGR